MARRQYQYQPVTGPVWRAAVAASLAWLPTGNAQPVRVQPAANQYTALVGVTVVPVPFNTALFPRAETPRSSTLLRVRESSSVAPVVVPFDPATYPHTGPPFPVRLRVPTRDATVLPPPQVAPAFDAATFPHTGPTPPARALPAANQYTGLTDVTGVPPAAPAFDPASLTWLPAGRAWPQRLQLGTRDVSVLPPFQPAAPAFDPATFPHSGTPVVPQPRTRWRPAVEEVAAIEEFDPARLQWQPMGRTAPPRGLKPGRAETVLPAFQPAAPFDPASLTWLPSGRPWPLRQALATRDYAVLPPVQPAAFDPAGLQWLPGGRPWATPRVAGTRDWSVLPPFQPAAAPFDPATFPWNQLVVQPRRLAVAAQPDVVVVAVEVAPPVPPVEVGGPSPGGSKRTVTPPLRPRGRRVVEPHVRLEKPEPAKPPARDPVVERAEAVVPPAPARVPFTFPRLVVPPLDVGGMLPPPSAEMLVLAGLAPDLYAAQLVVQAVEDDRRRWLLFAAATLT